jgi:hypothetical protein
MAFSFVVTAGFLPAADAFSPCPKSLICDGWYKARIFLGYEGSARFAGKVGLGRIVA